jgi:hypothetical protein
MVVFVKSDFPVQTGKYSPNKSIKRRSFCGMSINVYAFINFQILNAFDKEIIHTEQILKHLINTRLLFTQKTQISKCISVSQ